jgi:hypothetical protein
MVFQGEFFSKILIVLFYSHYIMNDFFTFYISIVRIFPSNLWEERLCFFAITDSYKGYVVSDAEYHAMKSHREYYVTVFIGY